MYILAKKRETREREGERERETCTCTGRARVGVRSKERERQTAREHLSDGTEIDFRVSKHNVRRFTKQLGSSSSQKHLNANQIKIEYSVN